MLLRLWRSLQERRTATALAIVAYTIAIIAAAAFLLRPTPGLPDIDWWMRVIAAVVLIGSAAVGIPTAWRGWWWIERGAAGGAAIGAGITLAEVVLIDQFVASHTLVLPVITTWGGFMAVLFFVTRFARTVTAPFAPGKGPMTPEAETAHRLRTN